MREMFITLTLLSEPGKMLVPVSRMSVIQNETATFVRFDGETWRVEESLKDIREAIRLSLSGHHAEKITR